MRPRLVLLLLVLIIGSCSNPPEKSLLIVVNVPLQRSTSISNQIVNGARLAVSEINAKGGVRAGQHSYRLRVEVVDSGLSPTATSANVRDAISRKAVAVIDEGSGVDAAWQQARDAGLPICVTYQGAEHLIDPKARPNVCGIL